MAATVTAAASHTLAGAHAPSPAILALAIAFAAVVCVLLAGRTLSLLLSQFVFHALFLAAGGGHVSVVGGSAPAAHVHDAATIELVASGGGHAAHSLPMTLAHLVAAVLTIAAVRRGEALFFSLGERLVRIVVRAVARASALLLGPVGPSVAVQGAPEPRSPRPLDAVLTHLRHRGPPRGVLRAV